MAALPEDVAVLSLDLRGHGESGTGVRASATIERLADDVAEVIAKECPEGNLVLAGHSLGGMTLMALGELHPDIIARTTGVAFVSTTPLSLKGAAARMPALVKVQTVAALVVDRGLRKLARARGRNDRPDGALPVLSRRVSGWLLRQQAFGRSADPAAVQSVLHDRARAHRSTSVALAVAMDAQDHVEALAAYRGLPGRVLVGSLDRLTPVQHARTLARELPRFSLQEFSGAGHILPMERAQQVAAQLCSLF